MPELPEVETVKRGLAPFFEGATIVNARVGRPDLRFPFPENFTDRLEGRTVTSMGRRAKYLMADLDSNDVLVMHLGMSGSFRCEHLGNAPSSANASEQSSKLPKHDHVVFELSAPGQSTGIASRVIYNDPRRFGFMTLVERNELETHPLFAQMGLEPLGNALNGELLAELFKDRKTPFKSALLNQKFIAGLGNIYVCEALWRAGIDPRRAVGTLAKKSAKSKAEAELLAVSIRDVLEDAIRSGGSSLKDHVQTDGSLGYFQHSFAVYDREREVCRKDGCSGIVERIVQSGRSTFFCPRCQR